MQKQSKNWPGCSTPLRTLDLGFLTLESVHFYMISTFKCNLSPGLNRAVASLTVPGGQEFHFPLFFLKFRSIFLIFPHTLLIVFLILALRVGESRTREGPGYATGVKVL